METKLRSLITKEKKKLRGLEHDIRTATNELRREERLGHIGMATLILKDINRTKQAIVEHSIQLETLKKAQAIAEKPQAVSEKTQSADQKLSDLNLAMST
jgi:hypothetical protein